MTEGARMAWWHGGGEGYGRTKGQRGDGGEKRGETRDGSRKSGATLSHVLRESSEDIDVMISFSNTEVAGSLTIRVASTEVRAETNKE